MFVTYTVRGVPREADRGLREMARQRGISLNELVVEQLVKAAGDPGDLKSLVERWKEDPEFDRIVDEQRQIDW